MSRFCSHASSIVVLIYIFLEEKTLREKHFSLKLVEEIISDFISLSISRHSNQIGQSNRSIPQIGICRILFMLKKAKRARNCQKCEKKTIFRDQVVILC